MKGIVVIGALLGLIAVGTAQSQPLWSRGISIKPFTYAQHTAVDSLGNVAVCGQTQGNLFADNSTDWFIRYYNKLGTLLWTRTYNGPGNGQDSPFDLAFDSLRNLVVVGSANFSKTINDYRGVARKYTPSGGLAWMKIYTAGNGTGNYFNDVEIGKNNDVFITGSSTAKNNQSKWLWAKYTTAGVQNYAKLGPGSGRCQGIRFRRTNREVEDSVLIFGQEDLEVRVRNVNPDTGAILKTFSYKGDYEKPVDALWTPRGGAVLLTNFGLYVGTTGLATMSLTPSFTLANRKTTPPAPNINYSGVDLVCNEAGYVVTVANKLNTSNNVARCIASSYALNKLHQLMDRFTNEVISPPGTAASDSVYASDLDSNPSGCFDLFGRTYTPNLGDRRFHCSLTPILNKGQTCQKFGAGFSRDLIIFPLALNNYLFESCDVPTTDGYDGQGDMHILDMLASPPSGRLGYQDSFPVPIYPTGAGGPTATIVKITSGTPDFTVTPTTLTIPAGKKFGTVTVTNKSTKELCEGYLSIVTGTKQGKVGLYGENP